MNGKKFNSVNEYHQQVSSVQRHQIEELRETIRQAVPNAAEVICYNMPAFKTSRVLVYYAACQNHIGFYPTASPIVAFKEKLAAYKTSKGAIQFPLDKPIPNVLVKEIVLFRLKEVEERARTRQKVVK
jgi:uncharacterized protein YdhG (YjbR/CyaY superfamily)